MLPTAASARHTECVCVPAADWLMYPVWLWCVHSGPERSPSRELLFSWPRGHCTSSISPLGEAGYWTAGVSLKGKKPACVFLLVTRNIQIQFSFAGLFIIFLIMRLKLFCRRRCSYGRLTIFAKDKHCVFYGKKTKNSWRLSTITWKYLSGINSNWPKTNEGKNQSELCSERTDTWNCISLTPVKTTWLFEKIEFEFSRLQFLKFLSNETVPSTKLELVQKTK